MGAIAKYREEEEMALPSSLVRKVNLCELDNAEGVEGQSNPHQCPLELLMNCRWGSVSCHQRVQSNPPSVSSRGRPLRSGIYADVRNYDDSY